MAATFTITEDDYVKAAQLHCRSRSNFAVFFGSIVAGLVLISILEASGISLRDTAVPEIVMIGGIVFLVFLLIGLPYLNHRHYRKYKLIQDSMTIRIEEQGLEFQSKDYSGTIAWEKILKWRQDDSFLLIYPAPQLYYVIPKRLSEQGIDFAVLTRMLEQRVGKVA